MSEVGDPVPGWAPPPRPPRSPLLGDHVAVVPFEARAVDGLWEAFGADDPGMWTYMGYGPFRSRDELAETVASWPGSDDPMFFVFEVDDRPVGWGSYLRIEPSHGVIEVGHLAFSRFLRRTTAATEAMYLMAQQVFDLGYRRYEWKADALNRASGRAAERLGFVFEGVFRQHMVYKGRNRDTAWWSITDGEWPEVARRLQAWLHPSNFDGEGRQISKLGSDGSEGALPSG